MAKTENKITFQERVESRIQRIQQLYLADSSPWVIGYSGGKYSTAVVQLAWMAISSLEKKYLKKPVHIITTDTMVENPIVSSWVNASLDSLNAAAKSNDLPIEAHLIKPSVDESFG